MLIKANSKSVKMSSELNTFQLDCCICSVVATCAVRNCLECKERNRATTPGAMTPAQSSSVHPLLQTPKGNPIYALIGGVQPSAKVRLFCQVPLNFLPLKCRFSTKYWKHAIFVFLVEYRWELEHTEQSHQGSGETFTRDGRQQAESGHVQRCGKSGIKNMRSAHRFLLTKKEDL